MIGEDGEEEEYLLELESVLKSFTALALDLELKSMLSKPEDQKTAIFTIHAGSGGTEAQDWANMLLRMYTRFFDSFGFKYKQVDFQPGDIVGVKSVTMQVEGDYAFGYLKAETGVHRLIRISPFDAAKKRHTSFASVYVTPVFDDVEVELDMKDVRVDTYRASGAGGQHVNKTDSAVRLTHIPTGLVAQSQAERSQVMNKEFAMKMLKSKLYQKKLEEEKAKQADLADNKMEISWGSQIRTYTFQPYNLVKDHRTNYETGNTSAVMDGDLEQFIRQYLLKISNINQSESF